MFQITAPVDSLDKIKVFEKLWVRDYYAWWWTFHDWEKKYQYITYINWRSSKTGNFQSIQDFITAIKYSKENNLNLALTFNNLPWISDDKILFDEIKNINETLNPTTVIVYDYLSTWFIDKSKTIHISNQATIYDEDTFKHWIYLYPNIKRIIFPRDTLLDSLYYFMCDEKLKEKEIEIFIKNQWCYHANNCTSMHQFWIDRWIPILCDRERKFFSENSTMSKKLQLLFDSRNDCKVCWLHKVLEMKKRTWYKKDIFLKIVWRTLAINEISKDILFVKIIIATLKWMPNISYKEFFLNNIKLHKKIYWNYCNYNKCQYSQEININ